MEVRGVNSARPTAPVQRPEIAPANSEVAAARPAVVRDEVEISSAGKLLDDASRMPGVREQRLEQIKQAIEAGTYETPEKLEMALNRMLEKLKFDD